MPLPENASNASSPTQKCLFLTLPLEVRYSIYKFVLLRATPIQPNICAILKCVHKFKDNDVNSKDHPPETVLAISRTCRQIQHESLTIYYGLNVFSFSNTLYAYLYLSYIGQQRCAYVRNIQFMWAIYRGQASRMNLYRITKLFAQSLSTCVSLRTLHIGVARHARDGTSVKYSAPTDLFVSEATPLLRAALCGRGDSIEIKVREIFEWGREDNFEGEIKPPEKSSNARFKEHFDVDHLKAFEKSLREEAMKDQIENFLVAGIEDSRDYLALGRGQVKPSNSRELAERIYRKRIAELPTRYHGMYVAVGPDNNMVPLADYMLQRLSNVSFIRDRVTP
ncbi:hypothetical protein B7463_g9109, partial [Scytalidium lignicola]